MQRSMLGAAGRSRLLLFLLLFLPHNGQADDGCQGDYGWEYWRCGNVCTYIEQDCTCGVEGFGHNEGKWCCGTNCTGGSCLKWKQKPSWVGEGYYEEEDHPRYCAEWSSVICNNGITLLLNQSCHGFCNEHSNDKDRNYDNEKYVSGKRRTGPHT